MMLVLDSIILTHKCVTTEDYRALFFFIYMAIYLFLMLLFIAASMRLLDTLRTGFS